LCSDIADGTSIPHCYVCESLDAEVRVRTSDRVMPGPISCSADVLPFSFTFNIRPSQYLQYQKLKAAVKSQQRFDTMPRQRPFESPLENPSAWWKYAIVCVTSRPNSRPWQDVKRIGQSRSRYISLVVKKNTDRGIGIGFHAGLNLKQSEELLGMEDSLPIEALLAFHLAALRQVHAAQSRSAGSRNSLGSDGRQGTSRFRLLRTSGTANKSKPLSPSAASCEASLAASTSTQIIQSHQMVPDTGTAISQISLLEAMTLRLGKKVWFVDWKLQDATICTLFRRSPTDTPMLQFVLRASGNLKSFGLGKRDFSFAVSQCDIMHGMEKVLFFGPSESFVLNEETDSYEDDALTDVMDSLDSDIIKNPASVFASGEPRILRGPDLATPSSYLELPAKGTACRIIAGKDHDTFKLSMSAHPATLVWTNSLSDSILEIFSEKASDLSKDLTQHIRNFATPMARKAQLALLSPASMSLHLNIAAPKVWIPIISGDAEGSLVLDAGTFCMNSSKDEGETEVQWKVQARDIGAKFVRGLNMSRFTSHPFPNFRAFGAIPIAQGESVVVRPFTIDASSSILRGAVPSDTVLLADPIRNVDVVISPICLNLVDAEMIARLLGKLYARGLHRVRRESPSKEESSVSGPSTGADFRLSFQDIKWSELPRILTMEIEKIEIALEGHSKPLSHSDERSMASLDTALQEYAPPTRAYLVEIFNVSLKKSSLRHTEMTRLTIIDASIVRLRDVSLYTPLGVRREQIEPENRILVRASEIPFTTTPLESSIDNQDGHPSSKLVSQPEIFRASLLHNRQAHLNEVEVDIDSVILRITPTTLKDCTKAFRRIMELAHLVTKEMERKVHEEGRKARRRSTGMWILS
jgi:Vacuolar sorting-associated protein 13, N-terminal